MAKRFTDTEKWKKHFIRGLQAPYKLLWLYICDECSTSGIWDVDLEVAQIRLGVKLKKETAIASFADKILQIDGGQKWFIKGFVEFQYVQLSDTNRAHTKAIFELQKFNLLDEFLNVKPLTSPLQGAMVLVEDKEEDKVKVEDKEKEPEINLIFPFESGNFKEAWEAWKRFKKTHFKFSYKTKESEQAGLKEIGEISHGNEETAIKIIQKSISNGWKGLFELKDNGQSNPKAGTKQYRDQQTADYAAKLAQRLQNAASGSNNGGQGSG